MNVKDIFAKMDVIIKEYNATHDFSGTTNHIFFITPHTHKQIEEYYAMDMRDIRCIQYRGYPLYKWKGMNDENILFAEVHHAMNTGCMFDEPPMWKYLKEKEVRKKMAIDYKVEWEKLSSRCGAFGVNIPHEAVSVTLRSIMENQIDDTIEIREGLMQEYVRAQIGTEIIGADRGYHRVKLEVFGESRGTVPISKNAFNTWLRNREKKKKGGK